MQRKITGFLTNNNSTTCKSKKKGSVNTILEEVATLSPTPRVFGKFIQDETAKGEIMVLPDSGLVAKVMPVTLASSLNLAWQEVNPERYLLSSTKQDFNNFETQLGLRFIFDKERHVLISSPDKRLSSSRSF